MSKPRKSKLLSTAIAQIIGRADADEKIIEYSAPIEYVYDGSTLDQHPSPPLTPEQPMTEAERKAVFERCVRNALRRKPTIIIIE